MIDFVAGVAPGDVEQIDRVERVGAAGGLRFGAGGGGDFVRVEHFFKGGAGNHEHSPFHGVSIESLGCAGAFKNISG